MRAFGFETASARRAHLAEIPLYQEYAPEFALRAKLGMSSTDLRQISAEKAATFLGILEAEAEELEAAREKARKAAKHK